MTTEEQRTAFLNLKPSALIRSALQDLKDCDAEDEYEIDMGFWHRRPREEGDTCLVCLAGACMSKSLGVAIDEADKDLQNLIETMGFISKDADRARRRFDALDEVRLGQLHSAVGYLRVNDENVYDRAADMDVTEWDDNPKDFCEDVEAFALMLEEEGF